MPTPELRTLAYTALRQRQRRQLFSQITSSAQLQVITAEDAVAAILLRGDAEVAQHLISPVRTQLGHLRPAKGKPKVRRMEGLEPMQKKIVLAELSRASDHQAVIADQDDKIVLILLKGGTKVADKLLPVLTNWIDITEAHAEITSRPDQPLYRPGELILFEPKPCFDKMLVGKVIDVEWGTHWAAPLSWRGRKTIVDPVTDNVYTIKYGRWEFRRAECQLRLPTAAELDQDRCFSHWLESLQIGDHVMVERWPYQQQRYGKLIQLDKTRAPFDRPMVDCGPLQKVCDGAAYSILVGPEELRAVSTCQPSTRYYDYLALNHEANKLSFP